MRPEILAPAGSFESLVAAVRSGANAVYLGGRVLNARRNATNFSDEELKKAVDYCHKRAVKVYVTVNTLVTENEFDEVLDGIEYLCGIGVDALIVQDLGLASLIHKYCPDMPLHASTQMSVQSLDGVNFLRKMGFSRVVLPRELSEKEIKAISSQTDTELEYFVHGALCMCVSGQCLMSSMLGGRSGNRGLCAQPCRLPFGVNGKDGNNLSLKDLSLIEKIPALVSAGVCSLKIEGRMKRPEYVAAAVTGCKNAVENIRDEKITNALGAVFSRSGFTSGYFDGKLGKDMFGIRTKDDVENSSAVLKELSHLYDNENQLLNVSLFAEIKENTHPVLTAKYKDFSVTATIDEIPQRAVNKALTAEDVGARLSKTGGTQFKAEKVSAKVDDNLFMPASSLNLLRRNAFEMLENAISEKEKISFCRAETELEIHRAGERKLYVQFFYPEQIPDNPAGCDRVIIPLSTDSEKVKKLIAENLEVAAEIPVNVFSQGEYYCKELLRLKALGVTLAVASNIDGIEIARKCSMEFATGFGMNVINSYSAGFLEKQGAKDILLSAEINSADIPKIMGKIPRGVLTYGRIPLMVTRNCPVRNKLNCSECEKSSELVDRMNVRFPVRCKNGCSFIFNSVPVYTGDKASKLGGIDYELLYFTTESKEECAEIIKNYREHKRVCDDYTGGLYFRTVL